jgi:hypothetical protein
MFDVIISIVFFLIPWAIGWTVIADKEVFGLFFSWLWSGMDEEKRYEWIKIARW